MMSDGEKSGETIVQKIKRSLKNAILNKFVNIKGRLDTINGPWDTAYFPETIG